MRLWPRIIWIVLSLFFFFYPFLAFAQKERTVFVVWDEFVKVSNSGADHVTEVQTYLKNCIQEQVSPEEFYSIETIKNLEKSAAEFRQSADKLDELRRRLEHPIPKGTVTAKR